MKHSKLLFLFISFLFAGLLSCQKEVQVADTVNNPVSNNNAVAIPLRKNIIQNWLNKETNTSTPIKNNFIKNVLANLEFESIYAEKLWEDETITIVPLKNNYFSQYVQDRQPLQYLIIVHSPRGIRKADIVLFFPKNNTLKSLPENSFHDFFNYEQIAVDGTFSLVSLGDVRQFEMDFNNGEKKQFRVWKGERSTSTRDIYCLDWYLVTTYYNPDGSIDHVESEFLGTTCSSCPPNELCDEFGDDPNSGGGGGGGEQPGVTVNIPHTFTVKKQTTSYEYWEIWGTFTLNGVRFNNPNNNFFNSITALPATMGHSGGFAYNAYPMPGLEYSCTFSYFSNGSLLSNTSASGLVVGTVTYPYRTGYTPTNPLITSYSRTKNWQANTALY